MDEEIGTRTIDTITVELTRDYAQRLMDTLRLHIYDHVVVRSAFAQDRESVTFLQDVVSILNEKLHPEAQ